VSHGERLFQHKARLWHGALGGVHQQQHAVHHVEHALHFATKIGVPGRVHNVDLDLLLRERIPDGDSGVLGEDRDAALAFERVRVQHTFSDLLIITERVRLSQQSIHQGGLAVIDMGNDSDVSTIGAFVPHGSLS